MATTNKQTATDTPLKAKRIVPTLRQRRVAHTVAKAIEDNTEYKTGKAILAANGYGTSLQNAPARVLESAGTLKALEDLGFSEDNAKNVVHTILSDCKARATDRLKAADMVFKVHGTYAAEKHVTLNVDANVDSEAILALAERMRDGARRV